MPRGMLKTTILSHGRMHDTKGVKGTYLKGTVPKAEVLDSIPTETGAVGNVPGTALPGDPKVMSQRAPFKGPPSRHIRYDAEGDPIMPGGNRDGAGSGGPSTMRPQFDDPVGPLPGRSSSGQVPAEQDPGPTEAQIREAAEADEAARNRVLEERAARQGAAKRDRGATVPPPPPPPPAASTADEEEEVVDGPPLPTSKRRLMRAKVADLRVWCARLDIDPGEYVNEGEAVIGNLMRALVGNQQGIDHGIVFEDDADVGEGDDIEG